MRWPQIPQVPGIIERRLLVNYRIDPEAVTPLLPPPFQVQTVNGYAVGGICLIRLRVGWAPPLVSGRLFPGFVSENGAHRIAVNLPENQTGVWVPQRHTSAKLNQLLGGRAFPGTQQPADFVVEESEDKIAVTLTSTDGTTMAVAGKKADRFSSEVFDSLADASSFFEHGSLGYSATTTDCCYDGITLDVDKWSVSAFSVDHVASSFFDQLGSAATFDHALLMTDIKHRWRTQPQLAGLLAA